MMVREIGLLRVEGKGGARLNSYLLPSNSEMFEFTTKGERITIASASPSCVFCGRLGMIEHLGKVVCMSCISYLKQTKRRRKSG